MAEDKRRDIAHHQGLRVSTCLMLTLGILMTSTLGDELVVIGNPLGLEDLGRIRHQRRGFWNTRPRGWDFERYRQTLQYPRGTAAPPCYRSRARWSALFSFRITGGESLNFAIPINYLRGLQGIQASAPLKTWSQPLSDSRSWFCQCEKRAPIRSYREPGVPSKPAGYMTFSRTTIECIYSPIH